MSSFNLQPTGVDENFLPLGWKTTMTHSNQLFGNVNTFSIITYGPSVTITDLIHHYKVVSIFGVIGNLKMALASYLINYILLYGITWYCFVLNGIAW